MSDETVSIAIETSCRAGGLVLGIGDEQRHAVAFDASARHATRLVAHLAEMVRAAGLRPADVGELYVSAGPGSFTGLRVGITAARTMAQAIPHLRCVAVPTALAVAENARDLDWQHLAVVFDAREGAVHVSLFCRCGDSPAPANTTAGLWRPEKFLASAPRPLLLIGEGLAYHDMAAEGVTLADASLHLPTAEGVWCVGRRMARAGEFTDYHHLLPVYAREPHVTTPRRAAHEGRQC